MTSLLRTISYSVIRSTRRSLCANHKNPTWCMTKFERSLGTQQNTESVNYTEEALRLSQSAIKRLRAISEKDGSFLRVIVEGGGCSGFQTKFDFDTTVNEDDVVIEKEGIKVAIDNDSLEFIRGSTLDFHEELIRSAFSIVNNPQAEQGCSCGASFSLKL